jgi:hypothetical protein
MWELVSRNLGWQWYIYRLKNTLSIKQSHVFNAAYLIYLILDVGYPLISALEFCLTGGGREEGLRISPRLYILEV